MAKIAKKVIGYNEVIFTFTNGVDLVADLTMLTQDIINRLALHGLSQKLGDSYASANEKGWSVDECYDQAANVFNNLKDGNWAVSGGSGTNILAEAVARITGLDVDECAAKVRGMTDGERKELAKRADVKAVVLDIKAERAKAKVKDTDADASDLADLFI